MNSVYYLAPNQLKRALLVLWRAKVPACVIGGVGSGKTTAVVELAKDLRKQFGTFDLWPLILSYMGPEDIGGVPYPNADRTRVDYLVPSALPFDTDAPGIILGDEYDRASPEVQNSFLQILLGGTVHGHVISKNAFVVLAMNGTSDIYTTQLSSAAITRVCTLFISTNAAEYMDSYDEWADNNGISPLMRGFARFTPDLISSKHNFEELAIPTPRTRDMADRILNVLDHSKLQTDDIKCALLAGVIGRAATVQLLAFRDLYNKTATPAEIIKDPEHADVPTDINVAYALVCALAGHIKNVDTADRVCKYVVRLPDELTGLAFRRIYKKCNKIVTNDTYVQWAKEHKYELDLETV